METRGGKEIFYDLAMILCSSNQIVMTVHSTNHNGGNGQHPSENPYNLNADLTLSSPASSGTSGLMWDRC